MPRSSLAQLAPLPRSFFNRDPRMVGRELLGKVLLRSEGRAILAGRIVECEAYLGADDAAAHSAAGKTARNAVLFGPPGYAYVYFIYGNHFCLNVSCLPDDEPGGVLFRALLPLEGIATMAHLRGLPKEATAKQLTGGPGKLCEALGISRSARNGVDVTQAGSSIQILDDGVKPRAINVTPRIGIRKAAGLPLRFVTDDRTIKAAQNSFTKRTSPE